MAESMHIKKQPTHDCQLIRVPLRLKIAQKPYIVWSLGPKALTYESLEPQGLGFRMQPEAQLLNHCRRSTHAASASTSRGAVKGVSTIFYSILWFRV